MTLHLTLTPSPPSTIRLVRRWSTDDPNGFDARQKPINGQYVGQFCFWNLLVRFSDGSWGGTGSVNSGCFNLTNAQMLQIAALQKDDDFTVSQKMNYLMNGGNGAWGRPMKALYESNSDWRLAQSISIIGAVWAGQPVEIIGHTIAQIAFNNKTETVGMSQIQPGTLQRMTVVDEQNNYNDHFKGTIWLPVPKLEWDYAGGKQPVSFWLLDRWLQ